MKIRLESNPALFGSRLSLSRFTVVFTLFMLAVFSATLAPAVDFEKSYASSLEGFELDNNYGKAVALSQFDDREVLALVFLGTECPLAKLYGPKLNVIQEQFADRGVQIIGVSSNKQDSLTELTAYVHRYEIDFPILKDVGNRLADALGAERTPEVFVFDKSRKLRYHGRIDDQYGVGYSREKTRNSDLSNAIESILTGEEIAVTETKAIGCIIGRVKDVEPSGEITFTKDIAPILNARCVECHREGEIGPFTLTSYEDVLGWEDTILEVIEDNRMPPWSANPEYGHFSNDARLSESEKNALRQWVSNGMPEGDASDLPPTPEFADGWKIPKPDEIFNMRDRPFTVPAQGIVDYQNWIVDPGWTEDKYIYAAEARPQNRAVVHHILVYILPPGARGVDLRKVLVGYAPGGLPIHYQDGLAIKVPAGSRFLFQMHYTPNGTEQTDLSYAGVCFIDESKVTKLVEGNIAATKKFEIPPQTADYSVQAPYRAREDQLLISMTPHMHLRGKSFRYVAHYPGGKQEVLLDVPQYDFNWQLKYILAEPKLLPKNTRIVCTAVYDNSESNLVNPDPSKSVRWGDQSYDEMMIGFMDMIPVK